MKAPEPTTVLRLVTEAVLPLPDMDQVVYDMSMEELNLLMRSLRRDQLRTRPDDPLFNQVAANINLVRNRIARLRGNQQ